MADSQPGSALGGNLVEHYRLCVCSSKPIHTISSVVSSSQNTVLHSSLCEDFIFLNQTTTLMKTDASQRCVGNQELPFITIPSFTPPYFI